MSHKITNNKLLQTMRQLIEKEISFIQPHLNGSMFDEFIQKTKLEYPYVGKFIEDRHCGKIWYLIILPSVK